MLKVIGASWYQTKVISIILGAMVALGIIVYIFGESEQPLEDGIYSATVFYSKELGFQVSFWGEGNDLNKVPKGVARAHYKTDIVNSGWAFFEVQTNSDSPDWYQAFAAGVLEGSLSWQLIYWHWFNTVRFTCEGREQFCDDVRAFVKENWEWTAEISKQQEDKDPFWHQVHLYIMQLQGLEHGFRHGAERSRAELDIPSEDFIWMNIMPDLVELEQKFNGTKDNEFSSSVIGSFSSAFIKLLPSSHRLIFAHNTGGRYQAMQRIMKKYEFHYHLTSTQNSPEVPGKVISFSSYPAILFSQDDFYSISGSKDKATKHQLVISGTTINNYNEALWNFIDPVGKVLLGPRVMSANRLATCGRTWGINMLRFNSGTGNKQWLVVDYNRLIFQTPSPKDHKVRHGKKRFVREPKGLLWVWEQYPGFHRSSDQTNFLHRTSYWAAYGGLPFHKDILTKGHFTEMEKEYGLLYSHDKSPIGRIFKRDHLKVTNISTAFNLMRSNEFSFDPLSRSNPLFAISPRADLNNIDPQPAGAIDTKVISGNLQQLDFQAISGPSLAYNFVNENGDDDVENDVATYEKQPQPFQWSLSKFSDMFHFGQPDVWHFSEIGIKWFWSYDVTKRERN
ncbi:hypothetical protein R5R35_004171 [Gryllus longicercus]|uniref:Phospholipase B-like n=1 Tax=Gryllus longicercus TaxID=2509291 RepID=A0AAN9Z2M6_9ORTH